MKRDSIREHLQPYSIHERRATTIHHAFASAIAPSDDYDDERIKEALRKLGQDPDQDLKCVYCDGPAETWDHIFGLVKNKRFSGYGHTIGNLVPCCLKCNSKKGNMHWEKFLKKSIGEDGLLKARVEKIQQFLKEYQTPPLDQSKIEKLVPDEMRQLQDIKQCILTLMQVADKIAEQIRKEVQEKVQDQQQVTLAPGVGATNRDSGKRVDDRHLDG